MAQFLKQSTAFTFRAGPFVDSTDGVTAETALTIAQADIQISKNGGAFAQTSAGSPTTTHDSDGYYQCPLTTTDTNTLGTLRVQLTMAGALPVWEDFTVLPANVFDSLMLGSDLLDVNTAQWLGTACATPTVAGVPEVDLTHISGAAASTSTAQLGVNVVSMAANSMTAAAAASDLTTELQSGLATSSALSTVAGYLDTEVAAILAAVDTEVAAIKAKTDSITFTVANQVDVNVLAISGDTTAADNLETAFDDTAGAVRWLGVVDQGTAQSATSTTVVLRSAAAFANDELIGATIVITGGSAGVGQAREITDYVSSTDTATVDAWTTTPTGTITYRIYAGPPAPATAPAVNLTHIGGAAVSTSTAQLGVNVVSMAANSMTAAAAASDLTTELQSGLATSSALSTVAGYLDTEVAAILAAVDTEVAAVKAVTDKLDTAMELDTSVYRFTTNALENAPAGGGGGTSDWSSGEREQIRHRLGIDGTASAASATPSLATAAALDTVDNFLDTEIAALTSNLASLTTAVGVIDDLLDTEVAAIKAKTDLIPAAPAAVGDIPTAAAIADAVHDEVVDGVTTFRQSIRLANSVLGGEVSGADGSTVVIRDLADTRDRVTATVDADGNRSAVVRDLT